MSKRRFSQPAVALAVASFAALGSSLTCSDGGEIVLDDFENDRAITSKDVLVSDISGWASEDGNNGVFDHEISGGQLRRVEANQGTTRVGAVFRIDLSGVTGPLRLEFDLVSGDINDLNFSFGIEDSDNTGDEVALSVDDNGPAPERPGPPPNPDVATWVELFTDGWAYDIDDHPRYTYDPTTGHVTADLSTDTNGVPVGDVSQFDLAAIYFNSARDRGLVIDNLKLVDETVAPPPALEILDVEIDHETNMVTLTWASVEGQAYLIEESTGLLPDTAFDPAQWTENQDSIIGEAGQTTLTFEVLEEHAGSPELFFRVREQL